MRARTWIAGLATIALGAGSLVAAEPQTAQELRDTAAAYYDVGDYDTARDLLGRSLAIEDSAEAYLGIGVCFLAENRPDDAFEPFVNAARRDKRFVDTLEKLSEIYSDTNSGHWDLDKAARALEAAAEIDTDNARIHLALGRTLFLTGTVGTDSDAMDRSRVQSERALKRALELDPTLSIAHSYLGQLYGTSGRHNAAAREFRKLVAAQPDYYQGWVYLAMSYRYLGLTTEAREAFEVASNGSDPNAREQAEIILQRMAPDK